MKADGNPYQMKVESLPTGKIFNSEERAIDSSGVCLKNGEDVESVSIYSKESQFHNL